MNRYDRNNSGSNFRGGRGRGLKRRGTGVKNSNENKKIKYDQGGNKPKTSNKGRGGKIQAHLAKVKDNYAGNVTSLLNKNNMNVLHVNVDNSECKNLRPEMRSDGILAKFLADFAATEHLTNTKLIFKEFNEGKCGVIRCANKSSKANLETEGEGLVEITNNGKRFSIENVICAKDLSENLLSLRRFAELGLGIYLDNKRIDIFDPDSNELLMTGLYQSPYWIIELGVTNSRNKEQGRLIMVNMTENSQETRYITRSVTAKHKFDENNTGPDEKMSLRCG